MSNLNLKSVIQSTQSYVNQVRCRDVSEVFHPSVYKLHHPARPMEFPLLNGLDEEDGSRAPKNGCHHAPEDGQDGRPLPEDGLEGRSHPRMAATSPRMVTLRSRMVPLCALMPLVRSKATLISSTEH